MVCRTVQKEARGYKICEQEIQRGPGRASTRTTQDKTQDKICYALPNNLPARQKYLQPERLLSTAGFCRIFIPERSVIMTVQPMLRTSKAASLLDKKTLSGKLSEIEEAALAKEIRSLAKADLLQAESLRAFSYAAEGRFEESFAVHEAVIARDSSEPSFIGNYAASLSLAGEHLKAARMFASAWEIDRTAVYFLARALDDASASGDPDLLSDLEKKYQSLTGSAYAPGGGSTTYLVAGTNVPPEYCYSLSAGSGAFSDWERPEEEEAWAYLQ